MRFIPTSTALALLTTAILLPFSGACSPSGERTGVGAEPEVATTPDPHSYSRPSEVAVSHVDLDLTVDFEGSRLEGTAALDLTRGAGADEVVLDTLDLEILGVTLDSGEDAEWELGERQPHLGAPLRVRLAPETRSIAVRYATSPEAPALQWLSPLQTTGGEHPFLFTQSQAILARSWVPCQDSPGVRITYSATIRVPEGLMAVMSAENATEKNPSGVYTFRMPQPIPSYLLALAVGDLEFRPLGERAGVFAEPDVVEAAAWEFADTERMMDAVEPLYGPYRWGRYDLLVLPPSFPFGGMENPRLTFVTPTIIAGDRSLVSLVAHELAHSWSGNLVTNSTWDDFWLNEGFTTYLTYRIMEELYGREYEQMLAALGLQDLHATVESLGPDSPDTRLKLDLAGRDPDDGMTDIAYEKGSAFLRLIEETVGRETWDEFVRAYFDAHAFESITTETFVAYLEEHLLADRPEAAEVIGVERWISGPGIPSNVPIPSPTAFEAVDAARVAWLGGAAADSLDTGDWSTHEWLHFLRGLDEELSPARMAELDGAFGFTTSGNSEILAEWLGMAIRNGYAPADEALEEFLLRVGRRKFLSPLYRELAKTPEGLERAREIYERARPGYHSVSSGTIDEILKG